MTDRPEVLIYDVKLPNTIEAYRISPESIRRNDEVAFVCDVLMPPHLEGPALRHYSFPDRWWAANVPVDQDGTRLEGIGPNRLYAFDCDITTPHFVAFGALCNIDLKLDVFARVDGSKHIIEDFEDFENMIAEGWIDDYDRAGAESGLAELLAFMEEDALIDFLEDICPPMSLTDVADVSVEEVRSCTDIPVLEHWRARRAI